MYWQSIWLNIDKILGSFVKYSTQTSEDSSNFLNIRDTFLDEFPVVFLLCDITNFLFGVILFTLLAFQSLNQPFKPESQLDIIFVFA